jgi:uncharacterized membrane protein
MISSITRRQSSPSPPAIAAFKNRQLWWVWGILAIGIGLRFANLSGKPIWLDEAFSLLHVSGFMNRDLLPQLENGAPASMAMLLQYQMPNPSHSIWQTITHIADTAPELPPLYFMLLHYWMKLFGSSALVIRSLSAIAGVLCLPCLYWLCWELFGVTIVGWYAMALASVSPFFLIAAQEARPYSLWSIFFLLSATFLLRAQRTKHRQDWLIWVGTMLLMLYTHLFAIVPWAIYTLYLAITEGFRWTRPLRQYVLASAATLLGFIPWIWFGFIDPGDPNSKPYTATYDSIAMLLKGFIRSVSLFLVDFNINEKSPKPFLLLYLALIGLAFCLIGYALYYLWKRDSGRAKWFVGLLVLVPYLGFLSLDLVTHTTRIFYTRYFIASGYLMIVAIAYLIASKQTYRFRAAELWFYWQRRFLAILLVGLLSCTTFLFMPTWWSKDRTQANVCIQSNLATIQQPLLVTDDAYIRGLAIAHHLAATVQIQFIKPKSAPRPLTPDTRPTFLYLPSPNLLDQIKQRYQVQPLCEKAFWRVSPQRQS